MFFYKFYFRRLSEHSVIPARLRTDRQSVERESSSVNFQIPIFMGMTKLCIFLFYRN